MNRSDEHYAGFGHQDRQQSLFDQHSSQETSMEGNRATPQCDATAIRKHQHGAAWAVCWTMRIPRLLTLAFHCSAFFFRCVLEHLLNFMRPAAKNNHPVVAGSGHS
jgi:hypothetical protein